MPGKTKKTEKRKDARNQSQLSLSKQNLYENFLKNRKKLFENYSKTAQELFRIYLRDAHNKFHEIH